MGPKPQLVIYLITGFSLIKRKSFLTNFRLNPVINKYLNHEHNKSLNNEKELLFTFSALIATTSCNIKKTDSEQIAGKKPMNIIYIMSDDHSYQTISAYDKRFIQTPNIDRLANEGVRFTNSFVANSISGPSRACILTGKHSHANGFTDNSSTFDGSQQTYPKLLQKPDMKQQ